MEVGSYCFCRVYCSFRTQTITSWSEIILYIKACPTSLDFLVVVSKVRSDMFIIETTRI